MGDDLERNFEEVMAAVIQGMKPLVRDIFMAGVTVGNEQSKHKITEAVMRAVAQVAGTDTAPASPPAPAPQVNPPRKNGGYNGVTEAVRKTLYEIARHQSADSEDMQDYIGDVLKRKDITTQQIRSSLKMLMDHEEAIRVGRGSYRAGPRLAAPANGASLFQHQPTGVQ